MNILSIDSYLDLHFFSKFLDPMDGTAVEQLSFGNKGGHITI